MDKNYLHYLNYRIKNWWEWVLKAVHGPNET